MKQKPLQTSSPIWSKSRLFLAVCFFGTAAAPAFADPGLTSVQPDIAKKATASDTAGLKLISGGGLDHGTYVAGVEISMPKGSHTYWKMPGDAGVPPVFVFNGSSNVDHAKVLFPAPRRIVEDGIEALGYTDKVIFPVMVTPMDPAKPASLHVDVSYAVCGKICLPAHGDATIDLAPGDKAGSVAAIDAALADVPVPIAPGEAKSLTLAPDGTAKKPTWTVTWHGTDPIEDVFADAPEGFYFDTRKTGPETWSLTAASSVASPSSQTVPVSLTLSRRNGSGLVATERLDVAPPTK